MVPTVVTSCPTPSCMSKKISLPPRDNKTGKFLTKPRQPPSSLATPTPTAQKPSQSLASSSVLTDEPSSPLISITSSLPGSFLSSAAASPAHQHSPAHPPLLPTRPILPPADPTPASLALADSALADLTPADPTLANTAAANSVSANPDPTNTTTNLASAANPAPADPAPINTASLFPADIAPAPTDLTLANTTLPYTRPLFPPARPTLRTTPLAPKLPTCPRSSSLPRSLALVLSLPPTLPPAVHFASYQSLALPLVLRQLQSQLVIYRPGSARKPGTSGCRSHTSSSAARLRLDHRDRGPRVVVCVASVGVVAIAAAPVILAAVVATAVLVVAAVVVAVVVVAWSLLLVASWWVVGVVESWRRGRAFAQRDYGEGELACGERWRREPQG
ncbi:hypothetical protein EDB85DRAFT_1892148 [Lactarius pseudohatsudake]|nr:hypothetical protein EDB85DRAFT_1892148 [Lactarius pseudohatsudake]